MKGFRGWEVIVVLPLIQNCILKRPYKSGIVVDVIFTFSYIPL